MLKDSPTPIHPTRRTHRTYTSEFKAQLVAACQQAGVSIAALAGSHAINANVLHRWLKEHARSGRHQRDVAGGAQRGGQVHAGLQSGPSGPDSGARRTIHHRWAIAG
ncbi:transposase [Rhodoferax ferrireducens]|uniref:transposase n=1 Tax=Rhodoferax ferrireducens TaxID=192843 RepID=UPI003BB69990